MRRRNLLSDLLVNISQVVLRALKIGLSGRDISLISVEEREINAIRAAKGLAFVINEENMDNLKELLQWTKN